MIKPVRSLADLSYCKDNVDHEFLLGEVQAEHKVKLKSYKCPRCGEELVKKNG